jgi:hypothetical protein
MAIRFIVKETPAPDPWVDRTDDSYWQCQSNCNGWNGTQWSPGGPGMVLVVKSATTWADGFRPTKMRVTGPRAYTDSVALRDGLSGNTIGAGSYTTEPSIEIDLDWQFGNDMVRLDLYPFTNVTKIEFYVP